jgi:transposase
MYVGVDLHKKAAVYTAVDDEGSVLRRGEVPNTLPGWREFAGLFPAGAEVALEPCVNWGQVCELLEDHGFRPALANSKRVRMIAESRNKTDSIDSEILAQLLRTRYLPLVHIPSRWAREARELVSYRATLGHRNTELKSRVHSILAKQWVEVPTPLFYGPGMTFLETIQLAPLSRRMLDGHLEQLRVVAEEVTRCQALMAQRALKDDRVLRLMEIRGLDYYTALILVSWIDDIHRFPDWRKLASYFGLVPSTRSSAEKAYHGHITKEGPALARWALVESVRYVTAENPKLRRALGIIGKRRGAGIGRVAVARRLVRIIYRMLKDGTHYEYLTERTYRRKLKEMEVEARRFQLPSEIASRS